MKAAVLVFPGSNREGDVAQAIELVTGRRPAITAMALILPAASWG